MRLYTQNRYPRQNFVIDTVSLRNCSGSLSEAAFLMRLANGSLPNSVASLAVSDCTLTAPTILAMAENFGTITLSNVCLSSRPKQKSSGFVPKQVKALGFYEPSPTLWQRKNLGRGSSLTFENCTINRDRGLWKMPASILANNSRIEYQAFEGFGVQDAGFSPPDARVD